MRMQHSLFMFVRSQGSHCGKGRRGWKTHIVDPLSLASLARDCCKIENLRKIPSQSHFVRQLAQRESQGMVFRTASCLPLWGRWHAKRDGEGILVSE